VGPECAKRNVGDYGDDLTLQTIEELLQLDLVLGHPSIEAVDSVSHPLTPVYDVPGLKVVVDRRKPIPQTPRGGGFTSVGDRPPAVQASRIRNERG